jgi:putative transposase
VVKAAWVEQGVIVHAVGTMPDHVHVAASIPPAFAVSEVVRRWKGGSSHLINETRSGSRKAGFGWQSEYGVVSFGDKALSDVIAYVDNQPQHHFDRAVWSAFERTDRERGSDGVWR